MNNLISKNDFESTFQVYAGTPETESFLDDVIERYQPKILRNILGEIEYQNFVADFTDGVPGTTKWLNFLNGETYTYNSVSYVYEGIKPVLVRFIYYYWHLENMTIPGETGQLKPEYQKIRQVINPFKSVSAWNDAIDLVQGSDAYYPTVWKYLNDAGYTFSDWSFTGFQKMNPYL